MKILIADDDPIELSLLKRRLTQWGWEVIMAHDGRAALGALTAGEMAPRIAILDWMMPGLDGPEVCRAVRAAQGEHYTFILLLSARSDKDEIVEGLEAGADDYLTKPFHDAELQWRLRAGARIVELETKLTAALEQQRKQASHDALTGLRNRRSILECLQENLDRSAREGAPIGVVIADVDHFKSINDAYGHGVGDQVLTEVAARLQRGVRNYDALGRYGGEEFVVILPGCDEELAQRRGEELRRSIASSPIAIGGRKFAVTASFGVSSNAGDPTASGERLIEAADQALYAAKKGGRNCVSFGQVESITPR